MATKAEIIEQITGINPEAETDDLSKAELEAMLEGLQGDAGDETDGDETDGDAAPSSNKTPVETGADDDEQEKPEYEIAPGCSLCCNRKNLTEGMEIKAEYLPGGQARLDELVEAGKVVKN